MWEKPQQFCYLGDKHLLYIFYKIFIIRSEIICKNELKINMWKTSCSIIKKCNHCDYIIFGKGKESPEYKFQKLVFKILCSNE